MENKLNSSLMNLIPFTETELELNKQGKFSEPQKEKLQTKTILSFLLIISIWIFCFAIWAVFFVDARLIVITIGILGFGILTIWMFVFLQKIKTDKGVLSVEGKPDARIKYYYSDRAEGVTANPVYLLTINSIKFRVDEEIFDSIGSKKIRVFYFPTPRKTILSVEIIERLLNNESSKNS